LTRLPVGQGQGTMPDKPISVLAKVVDVDGFLISAHFNCPFCGHLEETGSLTKSSPVEHIYDVCAGCDRSYTLRVVLDPVTSKDYEATVTF